MLPDRRTCALIAACFSLQGRYVTQAARGQLEIMNAREPISRVLEDPAAPADLRQRLETVRKAREFASRELGLPNNKSYTSYVDLERDYVVWNVVATPEFSVEPRQWCFPIVGCVAYRGYFKEANARQFVPSASAAWEPKFPGLFTIRDGVMRTGQLTGPGLGAVAPGKHPVA